MGIRAAEVMTPFGDAVCFVNCDSRQLPLCVYCLKAAPESITKRVFWGYVKKADMGVT